ncbi:MAG: hypothetical protein GEU83_02405 [Pseudonocardiaceae bacterium]|nr:hypothetical protein [Pseudonocardiaceae bacterium]
MMRLIFFASADPATDPKPVWSAYHFANVASQAGLDAEVRLAGDAVRVAMDETELSEDLRAKIKRGAAAPFLVSL